MKKFTGTVVFLIILIFLFDACYETEVPQLSSAENVNMKEESVSNINYIAPYLVYYFMDFKDKDGNWITNTDNRFFVVDKNDSITKIGVKVQGFPKFLLDFIYGNHSFMHETMDWDNFVLYNPAEWMNENSIQILHSEFKNNYYLITLFNKNMRKVDPQQLSSSEDPMWKWNNIEME